MNDADKLDYGYILNESSEQTDDNKLEESTDLSESLSLDYAYVLNESRLEEKVLLQEDTANAFADSLEQSFASHSDLINKLGTDEVVKNWDTFQKISLLMFLALSLIVLMMKRK